MHLQCSIAYCHIVIVNQRFFKDICRALFPLTISFFDTPSCSPVRLLLVLISAAEDRFDFLLQIFSLAAAIVDVLSVTFAPPTATMLSGIIATITGTLGLLSTLLETFEVSAALCIR
jgi:hypothetical protein